MPRTELYPDIEPFATGTLPRGGHTLYVEQCGNPEGAPVLFLHGGPGAGASPSHRRYFDPAHYRITIFDQRGAGRSRPFASVAENGPADLVGDIEALRLNLGIERWIVFGGSWGSTLALAYAETHAERVRALVLRGIFLLGQDEVDWFLHGMRRVFPDAWERFAGAVDAADRGDLLPAYYRRLMSPDPAVSAPAAKAWTRYEAECSTLLPSPTTLADSAREATALALARIEAHYFTHHVLPEPNALIAGIPRIRHLPGVIVQGRYDMVCPMATADRLARAWPGVDLRIVADAGHSAMEPGIRAELVAAMERLKGNR